MLYVVFLFQTVEFELRKLEAQQALQQVDLLKTFMPNSFLVSGGKNFIQQPHIHSILLHTPTISHLYLESLSSYPHVSILLSPLPPISIPPHWSIILCAGDYDAIQVLMLLPRIVFKADLVTDQLRQQVYEHYMHTTLAKLD